MGGTAELLNGVYRNSEIGIESLERLIQRVENQRLKAFMQMEFREYAAINVAAKNLLTENGYPERGLTLYERTRTRLVIELETLRDRSSGHIAQMLIQGSTLCVIDAIRTVRNYGGADSEITGLMLRLRQFEERNVERLKAFL